METETVDTLIQAFFYTLTMGIFLMPWSVLLMFSGYAAACVCGTVVHAVKGTLRVAWAITFPVWLGLAIASGYLAYMTLVFMHQEVMYALCMQGCNS